MRYLTFFLAIAVLSSCNSSSKKKPDLYFDLEEKIEESIHLLLREGKSLKKEAEVNGIVETVEIQPDSARWSHELQFFSAATINTIRNRDLYTLSTKQDEDSNLSINTYKHVNPDQAKIPWMEIYYLKNEDDFLKLSLEYKEVNKGFSALRNLTLEMDYLNGKSILKSYSIKGFQKILGQDSVLFKVRGEIL